MYFSIQHSKMQHLKNERTKEKLHVKLQESKWDIYKDSGQSGSSWEGGF